MSVLETPRPQFATTDANGVLRLAYGIDASLRPLDSERDQNFLAETADGRRFTLKIANAAEDAGTLDLQAAILRHVEQAAPELPLPRLIRTREGTDATHIASPSGRHLVRLVSFLEGHPLATAVKTPETLRSLGSVLGRLDRALLSFGHRAAFQALAWDLRRAGEAQARLDHLRSPAERAVVETVLARFTANVVPRLPGLRASVIHNDANDWNVFVASAAGGPVAALIDLGDAMHTTTVAELAIALAYAMLDQASPLEVAAEVIGGYQEGLPLEPAELDCLFDLVCARLMTTVTMAARRRSEIGDNPYLAISERPAWDLLNRLIAMNPVFVTGIFRKAAGFEAAAGAGAAARWIGANARKLGPLMAPHPLRAKKSVLPLCDPDDPLVRTASEPDAGKREAVYRRIAEQQDFELGIGLWGEQRKVYLTDAFRSHLADGDRRDVHLGLDLFNQAGTALTTPLDATVVDAGICPDPQDYGGVILLEHTPQPGVSFRSLWGHLSHSSARRWRAGDRIAAGQQFAELGNFAENGGWIPHLHLQLVMSGESEAGAIVGVGEQRFMEVWRDLFPDPSAFALLPPETFHQSGRSVIELVASRPQKLGGNLSTSYRQAPLKIVRGTDVWLIDHSGRGYLDCYNNVAQIGHCHPKVVAALANQAAILNTNTRYLHDNLIDYADRLTASLPDPLSVCYFVCSGSEANDLAVRMAKSATSRRDFIVIDWAYHGHTEPLIDLSPYKYKRSGGNGRPAWVHEVPLPDAYRAPVDWPRDEIGRRYAAAVREVADRLAEAGRPPAAFWAESLPSCGGQIVLPDGYLREAYGHARAAGALTLADEVQVGFGRTGLKYWEFQRHGVVPDFVAMGKPIGAGHPMAALVTTPAVAAAFANGMEYFNTFGGNPVAAAVGLAVLDVIDGEGLVENARVMGAHLLAEFRGMMQRFPFVGDVRGEGLFLGIDIVTDRTSKSHDGARANRIANRARQLGVLFGTDGPYDNVIKLRPPLTFRPEHAALLVEVMEQCFAEELVSERSNC